MSSPLARALREAASAALPPEAFLKRDRGDGLFVTDAPRRRSEADCLAALARAGFDAVDLGGLVRLTPGPVWLTRLETARPEPPDSLCAGCVPFRGLEPDSASLRLFALGARCLEGEPEAERFDRLLRQRIAECLRLNRMNPCDPPRGGGLYACALLNHELEVERL